MQLEEFSEAEEIIHEDEERNKEHFCSIAPTLLQIHQSVTGVTRRHKLFTSSVMVWFWLSTRPANQRLWSSGATRKSCGMILGLGFEKGNRYLEISEQNVLQTNDIIISS